MGLAYRRLLPVARAVLFISAARADDIGRIAPLTASTTNGLTRRVEAAPRYHIGSGADSMRREL